MTTKSEAPGGGPGAGLRRDAGAFPLASYFTPNTEKTQAMPPAHLVGDDEIRLWLRAEELRSNGDRDEYWQARRALLLAQAARWEVGDDRGKR